MSSESPVFPFPSYQTPAVGEASNKIIQSLKTPNGSLERYSYSVSVSEQNIVRQHKEK